MNTPLHQKINPFLNTFFGLKFVVINPSDVISPTGDIYPTGVISASRDIRPAAVIGQPDGCLLLAVLFIVFFGFIVLLTAVCAEPSIPARFINPMNPISITPFSAGKLGCWGAGMLVRLDATAHL